MLDWLDLSVQPLDQEAMDRARARQGTLTKPPGSLGRLEDLAIRMAGWQGTERPAVDRVRIVVFAADHGVAVEGVSAFPQEVTGEMIRNFAAGGAAISVLARQLGAQLEVVDVGAARETGALPGVIDRRVAGGTANFCEGPAMTEGQLADALAAGRDAVERARNEGAQLFIGGEMGIANTTAASAIACALLDRPPEVLAGPGTGLKPEGVQHKVRVLERALALHRARLDGPLQVLQYLGGFEIAALTGAYIACAQEGLPVLVDGFIATGAALAAVRLRPDIAPWLTLTHASAEPGHRGMVEALGERPLLDLGMRLGEGSGAAVAVPLLRLAAALHNEMATFAEAGVSEGG